MAKGIKVTNLFTGKATTYGKVSAFREDAKSHYDRSVAGIIDALGDAYEAGRPTGTYEWLLGVEVAGTDTKAA